MKFCTKCGAQNFDEANNCANCGAILASTVGAPVFNNVVVPQQQRGKGLAIAAMVCGIVSFFCFGVILGILAVIFGGVAKSKGYKGGMATAGIVLGIIGLALYVLTLILWGGAVTAMFGL